MVGNNLRNKAVSLFANVGIAEAYLSEIGVDVVVANEIEERRVDFYKHVYPEVDMIQGDITDPEVKRKLYRKLKLMVLKR